MIIETLTLTTSLGGPSLIFLNNNRLSPVTSTGKAYFRRQNPCNAVLHADPAVDSSSKTRFSLYEVLRVKRDATSNEIKAAYRNLAKVYHPDCSEIEKHDDRKFIEIHDAYATLCNPADRAMYDMKLNIRSAVGKRRGVCTFRRWETDQCW
ncbi:putative DnaJ domain, Chaperone J-domain superfamily [Helianthus annuus]|uniref:DnaJ domain, Chaperone J-domain superfamily n=1 Tax=Helianthus annuus TaxID=4232 RepID=A0A251V7M3_HELAN|nr:chaperone protein dnaJ 11, chloroplastic [Helianthus annuus]KAF5815072.1 putative DnaJ domain, Chaperone J-domain superfamily [Helianthus annuus]KAJ0593611.1 putative DnaJ domain, Chaperone J-domain superfamily [Helianthus annuus]KAJ0601539.1 putative DnaJ domain, Chaperone J-domain superfamily [Helianthus annuus]KAJ0608621.1 putative DnaJ domain, Chaperone J-domain superfamily [Helianthus annuus]KAJ0768681.1 putative DnaJ domain, Chaperone J-domain superfamily [Helianthus annuus]